MSEFLKSEAFILYGIPVLIALARVMDVSIGTLRIIFVAKGLRYLAPILGFFEVSVWLGAITQVMENLTNLTNFFAYAVGFSLGNYLGMYIETRLAIGMVVVRIITKRDSQALVEALRNMGYSVTVADAEGNKGPVSIVFTVVKRSDVTLITPLILKYNPLAVYSIEDVRHASDPDFPIKSPRAVKGFSQLLRGLRK